MTEFLSVLGGVPSVWSITKAAGLTSYVLLFLAIMAGMLQSFPSVNPKNKEFLHLVHQFSGWFGLLFGLLHGLVLVSDPDTQFSLTEIFVPFASNNDTILVSLGIISFYILFFIMLSSDVVKILGKKFWRAIHFLSFPAYVLALLHGVILGSDAQNSGIPWLYMITGASVAGLFVLRMSKSAKKVSTA
ncbi:ferric reductase-like transmembrane domain-containing protein [Bacillus sp. 1NLA3E]|uniref:ferric reductase-like transmembrane domain-containing protein n=1 Tax=Bacillus sp. 1NLA3E TaxID=666686 RepID=UPI000247EA3C|nr:ferric reductase-like transmembrane domain-containing protein [Bacillus sp. 1NLA3E]AGK52146.1 hypothetical protein B1NLA3E_01810 [Bacillus sp. 1NLA3E]